MNRSAFDHAVRAAGAVLGENEILVIGSQAVHGSKAVAMRQKDVEFCRALAHGRLVESETLRDRLDQLSGIAEDQRSQIARFIDSLSNS